MKTSIKFKSEKVDTLPEVERIKGSRFDAILFGVETDNTFPVKITVAEYVGKSGYLAGRLNQRIKKHKMEMIAKSINGSVYIDKA